MQNALDARLKLTDIYSSEFKEKIDEDALKFKKNTLEKFLKKEKETEAKNKE